jgi:TRAP-type uncharacterized transport system substrate-binding protein
MSALRQELHHRLGRKESKRNKGINSFSDFPGKRVYAGKSWIEWAVSTIFEWSD